MNETRLLKQTIHLHIFQSIDSKLAKKQPITTKTSSFHFSIDTRLDLISPYYCTIKQLSI